MRNLHRTKWPVIAGVPGHRSNLFHQFDRCIVALPEDRISAVQAAMAISVMKNCEPFVFGPEFA